jgi:hypothetical protein
MPGKFLPGLISPVVLINLMDIFFQDPGDIPLPPDEIRIRELRAEPYPDRRRVRIYLEITPFQRKPNCEISVTDESGDMVASLSIIESIDAKMDFTIHLKGEEPLGRFTVSADIYYYEDDETENAEDVKPSGEIHHLPSKLNQVDQRKTTFDIASHSNSD